MPVIKFYFIRLFIILMLMFFFLVLIRTNPLCLGFYARTLGHTGVFVSFMVTSAYWVIFCDTRTGGVSFFFIELTGLTGGNKSER